MTIGKIFAILCNMTFAYVFLGILILFALFYKFVFLRDLSNAIPTGNNLVSPASGKVISIREITKTTEIKIRKGFFGEIETELERDESYWLINIFMNPVDEHYTKMPCDGKVIKINRMKGSFRAVNTLEAGIVNEKQEFLLETKIGLVKVIQIAGLLARRTKSFVREGDVLEKGQKLGVILLGSQTALLFPKKHFALDVTVGQKVRAGETIISHLT